MKHLTSETSTASLPADSLAGREDLITFFPERQHPMRFLHAASLVIFANAYTAVISSDQDPLRPSAKTKTNQQLSAVKNSADWAQLKHVEHWPVSSTSDQPVS
jgi:hypothetical protein